MSGKKASIKIASLSGREELRPRVADIFVGAYSDSLSSISKDKKKLSEAFRRSFLLNRFYGAFIDDELAGIFALTDSEGPCFRLEKKDFKKQFGALKGCLVHHMLKKELEYRISLREKGYNIEAVATNPDHQGKGIATQMMLHAMTHHDYLELDVVDTNSVALKLYKKLGFIVSKEVPVRFFKSVVGYNKRIYMYYRK